MLAIFLLDRKYNKNGEEYLNKYQYSSGKTSLSCIDIYAIYFIYKIQAACDLKLLDEEEKKNLNISTFGYFEFIKDENFPKEIKQFNMPTYVKNILNKYIEWNITITKKIIPKVKIFEGKLVFTPKEIKPKLAQSSTVVLTNILNSLLINLKSDKFIKKEDSMSNNFTDVNFWKVNNTISDETKNKVNSKLENNSDNIDDEDELLNIAMNLEKKENENKNTKNINLKAPPKKNLIKKNEINTSSSNLKMANDEDDDNYKNDFVTKKDKKENDIDIKKEQ